MFCYILFEFISAGKMQLACTCAGLEARGREKRLYETGLKIQNRSHFALLKLKIRTPFLPETAWSLFIYKCAAGMFLLIEYLFLLLQVKSVHGQFCKITR
jgi:hypothetical protein